MRIRTKDKTETEEIEETIETIEMIVEKTEMKDREMKGIAITREIGDQKKEPIKIEITNPADMKETIRIKNLIEITAIRTNIKDVNEDKEMKKDKEDQGDSTINKETIEITEDKTGDKKENLEDKKDSLEDKKEKPEGKSLKNMLKSRSQDQEM